MRLARNMAAAMANSVAVVLINLVALPFYLRYLGMEAYGLIGFYATLQTVMQVLDLGLAPTVSREISHGMETGQQRRSASLLRTLGVVYVAVAIAVAGLIALTAPWIGARWLQAQVLDASTVTQAVALMGVTLACRWPVGLYTGALSGAHRLARAAVTSMIVNIAAAVTTVSMLAWGTRSIQAFFVVQACFGLLQAITLGMLAQRAVGERDAPFDFGDLRRVWRFSAWMSGVAIGGLLLTQIDKVVLSRLLPLEAFGHYMLAVLLVGGLQVLTLPVSSALYPKFSALLARQDLKALEHLYDVGSRLFATAVFALAFALAMQAKPMLQVWLRDAALAAEVAPLVAFMALGMACVGVMYMPYNLQLASGHPRMAFLTTLVLLVVMVPLVLVLATQHGALGGAIAWLALGVLYLFVGTWLTGRYVMRFAGWRWLASSVAVPVFATLVPALLGAGICRTLAVGPWEALGIGGLAALAGIGLGIAGSFKPREFRQVIGMALGRAT